MLVSDVMETDVVTEDVDSNLREIARQLVSEHIGSVVVTSDGTPTGIVTRTDVVRAASVTDEPLSTVPTKAAMSSPLETIEPDATIRRAVRRMTEERIKTLPVLDDMKLVGILSTSDVTSRYSDIVQEAHELDARRENWGADDREDDLRDPSDQ